MSAAARQRYGNNVQRLGHTFVYYVDGEFGPLDFTPDAALMAVAHYADYRRTHRAMQRCGATSVVLPLVYRVERCFFIAF